jgi:acyl-CoA thioesterase-2
MGELYQGGIEKLFHPCFSLDWSQAAGWGSIRAMNTVLEHLIALLRLEDLGNDGYRGQSQDLGWGRVYGGQVLGQAVTAAGATISGRRLHSLHAYFVRPGDTALPIDYQVERVRDGAGFSVRRVVASQSGLPIFNMSSSFQIDEEGYEHQFPMPDVPGPETIPNEQERARRNADKLPPDVLKRALADRPIEMRIVDPDDHFNGTRLEPKRYQWMRAAGPTPDDPIVHQCLLAYASDWGLLSTSLRPHGLSILSRKIQSASLDHAMWFHRDFRIDDWLLYVTDSPSASGARGFTRGEIFDRQGRLVASTAQEGLIRQRKKPE